ncbi:hypothetical protein BU15DRAFT_91060 [Melanogaster broomeanus]|nr:hypothetical protein BU15DRAFT_91060 [Melanogaster broomeanus]
MSRGAQNHNTLPLSAEVLAGYDRMVTFSGTSQFKAQGVSACGLAAFNFAKITFQIEQNKGNISDVLNEIGTKKVIEKSRIYIMCHSSKSLSKLVSTKYGLPRPKHFKRVLQDMREIKASAVVIITRPPEIIACLKLASATPDRPIFIVFDSHPLASQLLAHCSGHIFVADNQRQDAEESVIQSSLAVLSLRAEIEELKRQNRSLSAENQRLETEVDGLRDAMRQEQIKAKHVAAFAKDYSNQRYPVRSIGTYSNAVAGPSRRPDLIVNRMGQSGGARSIFADNPPPVPATKLPTYGLELAERIQIKDLDSSSQTLTIARQLQNQFDAEDQQLRRQHAELADHVQATFPCGICLEEQPQDNAATVDGCSHTIQDHRFPIFCPICTASDKNSKPAVISSFLIEQIGITEEQFQVWIEMELTQFSILINCRKCNRSAFVDRQDHAETLNIVCPLRDCQNVWCKACQQTIVIGGPKHSCDGSSELDHLMKTKGWHYCPSMSSPSFRV